MRLVFWLSLTVVAYAYVGYALLLALLARIRTLPVHRTAARSRVSVVLAVHNEEANLPKKLAALSALDFPNELLDIVVVSDGSTDNTNAILAEHSAHLTAVILPAPAGKAAALNEGVRAAHGDILVFMDARQGIDRDAITQLTSCFADPEVGAVSGELHLETADGKPSPDALGVYWKIEKLVRKLESATGSVVGATGALFAMRRELYVPLPRGTLLDDVLTPMHVARAGKRVLFLDTAIVRDTIFTEHGKEFSRKLRTLTGNYQLLQLAPWLLTLRNPLLFRFVSHKLLRLVVPFLLVLMLLASWLSSGGIYRGALWLQISLYTLALLGALVPNARRVRAVSISYTFVLLNAAAAKAFYNFLTGRARWA